MNPTEGTGHPTRSGGRAPQSGFPSLKTYGLLVAVILVARLTLAIWPAQAVVASQAAALSWPAVFVALALGHAGLYLARRTGFPPLSSAEVTSQERWVLPTLSGLGAGVVYLLLDLAYQLPHDLNVSFPRSIPFYLVGGFFVEVVLHLLPLSLFVWLFGVALLRGKRPELVFWTGAGLVAMIEPLMQFSVPPFSLYPGSFVLLGAAALYLINLSQLYFFKRAGFFALLSYRWVFYLLWHIIWGPLRLVVLFGN